MATSLSVVRPSTLRHFFSRTFCSPRPFDSVSSAVSINCLFSSSSSTAMNSSKTMKSNSTQTNNTVSSYNPHSLKAAIFKTLAHKIGNELNHCTISPSTRQAFFKSMYKVFYSDPKRYPLNSIIASMFLALQLHFVRQNPTTSLFSLIRLLIRITFIFYMLFKKPSMPSTPS